MTITHVALVVLLALVSCGKDKVPQQPCDKVTSFDECKKLPHCSAVRLFVAEGHTGPVWHCEPKGQR